MNGLLILLIIVLLGVAAWQLSKIFSLTQIGTAKDDSAIATDKDNNINGYLMFAFVAFIYIFTIYSFVKWGSFVLDTPASLHGQDVDNLMNISMAIIFFVQTLTQFLLHYFAFKYRGKEGNKALYFADNNKLEVIWSVIPAIVLAGLILFGLYAWTNIMFIEDEEDTVTIELYAQQFNWTARYAGNDNVLGKANVRYIEGVNTLGVDDPILDIAKKLEASALVDDYFVSRKLYPNVDFYSGIVQRALGIPTDMFTCIFALARTVGWIAQWEEMITDSEYKIGRPRQLFVGETERKVPPLSGRK